ncbi:MAG: DUF58 domain-containing protein [Desulfurococcaceae archaeon]
MLQGSRVLEVLVYVLMALGCVLVYFHNEHLIFVLVPVLLFSMLLRRPRITLLSAMYSGIVLVVSTTSLSTYMIAAPLSLLATLYYILYSGEESPSRFIYTLLLVLTPIYLFSARAIPIALVSATSLVLLLIIEYNRLSKSSVKVTASSSIVYLNDSVNIVVNVDCPGSFVYSVVVDDQFFGSKSAENSSSSTIRIRARRLGSNKHSLRVVLQDPRKLTSVEHGPYVIEYNVVPKFSELYREAEKILALYSGYISPPVISKLVVQVTPGTSTGASTATPGVEGAVSLPVSVIAPGGKYQVDEPGVRIAGDIETQEKPVLEIRRLVKPGEPRLRTRFNVKIEWRIPSKLLERIIQYTRGIIGEYMGVREYTPGDSLKHIHWKKSLRRSDIIDLVVKVYSSSDVDKRAQPHRSIVVADITATSAVELDLLLQTLYSYVISTIKKEEPPKPTMELYLYLITPRGEAYFIRGKPIDVLLGLNAVVQEEKLTTPYDYSSWHRGSPRLLTIPGDSVLSMIVDYYRSLGVAIVKDLESQGVTKGPIVLIHSRALKFKYHVISSVLSELGFTVVTPGI